MIYAGARSWLHGGNPYRFEELLQAYRAGGGWEHREYTPASFVSLYPPSTYLLFAPLGLLSWPAANVLTYVLNVLCVGALAAMGAATLRTHGVRLPRRGAVWLVVVLLVFGPVLTTIRMGQLSLVGFVLILGGLLAMWRGRPLVGGVLLGAAIAMKPQFAGAFILIPLLERRWQACVATIGTAALLTLAASLRLEATGHPWLTDLRANVEAFRAIGGHGDPSAANPRRHLILDLPVPLHALIESRPMVAAIAWSVVLVLTAVACAATARRERRGDLSLLIAAILGVLTLLPTYHRYYDAVLLVLPMLWVMARWKSGSMNAPAMIVAGGILVFLAPNTAAVLYEVVVPRVPTRWTQTLAWELLVLPHQTWVLLGIALALVWAMVREPSPVLGAEETRT